MIGSFVRAGANQVRESGPTDWSASARSHSCRRSGRAAHSGERPSPSGRRRLWRRGGSDARTSSVWPIRPIALESGPTNLRGVTAAKESIGGALRQSAPWTDGESAHARRCNVRAIRAQQAYQGGCRFDHSPCWDMQSRSTQKYRPGTRPSVMPSRSASTCASSAASQLHRAAIARPRSPQRSERLGAAETCPPECCGRSKRIGWEGRLRGTWFRRARLWPSATRSRSRPGPTSSDCMRAVVSASMAHAGVPTLISPHDPIGSL